MEMEIVKHWELLQATFKLYKAKDRTKMFWIEHWIALLESTNLLGTHTGRVKAKEARLHVLRGNLLEYKLRVMV
eukprot:457934-Pelagomonas_calceolata.AAC.1